MADVEIIIVEITGSTLLCDPVSNVILCLSNDRIYEHYKVTRL